MQSRDLKAPLSTTFNYWYPPPRWQQAAAPQNRVLIQDKLSVLLDVKIPKGKRRRVNNPCEYMKYVGTAARGSQKWRYNGSSYIGNSRQDTGVIIAPAWDVSEKAELVTAAYNSALSDLYEQIRGNIDLSIDAGQKQQTQKMIQSAFHLVEYARNFKRNLLGLKPGRQLSREEQRKLWLFHREDWRDRDPRVFDWRRSANEVGSKWLEYQYGWKPLVQEIYDTAELLVNPDTRFWEIEIVAHGKARDNVVPTGMPTTMAPVVYKSRHSARCELCVVVKPPNNRLQDMARFSSLNPASIAWELMPYSFVVDWFLDVGGYLRNLESSILYWDLFVSGRRTDTYRTTTSGEIVKYYRSPGYPSAGTYEAWTDCTPMESVFSHKKRSILSSMPMPARPMYRPQLGATRLANAAALLSQFLGRK